MQASLPFQSDGQRRRERASSPDRLRRRFERFHRDHPEVYDELVRLARQVKARGVERWSIKGLFEVVRYNDRLRRGEGESYKLNNNYSAFYARLIASREPGLEGFFRTREQRAA